MDDPPSSSPPTLSPAQRAVLYAIRRRGEVDTETLAAALDMTVSGARQHLVALADGGLVSLADAPRVPGRRGRVSRVARLTDRAESVFPKAYGELTNELLGYLTPESVDAAFDRRRDTRIEAGVARIAHRSPFAEQVRELARILDEDGYLADCRELDDGTFTVTEHNCAILSVAREHPHACASEIEFIRAVLPDATIERTEHIVSGAHGCTYAIRPNR